MDLQSEHMNVVESALKFFGPTEQMAQAQEECGKLIAVISQFRRGRATTADVVDEIADVSIMLEQMFLLFPAAVARRAAKVERLREMLAMIDQNKGKMPT